MLGEQRVERRKAHAQLGHARGAGGVVPGGGGAGGAVVCVRFIQYAMSSVSIPVYLCGRPGLHCRQHSGPPFGLGPLQAPFRPASPRTKLTPAKAPHTAPAKRSVRRTLSWTKRASKHIENDGRTLVECML